MKQQINIADRIAELATELYCLSSLTVILSNAPADKNDPHKDRPTARLLQEATFAIYRYQNRIAAELENEVWERAFELEQKGKAE